ncbi:hypothetical protein SAMN02745728_01575 [Desulfovibrio litoralis DSM 11393]|uniref:Uncharacterized protein n=1 Tax=Desulfovibrio litoralis DSM 11393 TaxID=1121455 RepID=A0A1M7T5R6_9BACT|nr:hypothetical protein SAMN02745728_01575 [Desulfovibrio litoralis DSM 11393]
MLSDFLKGKKPLWLTFLVVVLLHYAYIQLISYADSFNVKLGFVLTGIGVPLLLILLRALWKSSETQRNTLLQFFAQLYLFLTLAYIIVMLMLAIYLGTMYLRLNKWVVPQWI